MSYQSPLDEYVRMVGLGAPVTVPAMQASRGSTPRYSIAILRGLLEESARLRALAYEYKVFEIELPDDLRQEIERNERDVKASHRQELEQRLLEARRLVEELKSQEEKRSAAEAEIEKLKAALGK